MRAVLDTNVLIDYLRGVPAARDELGLYAPPVISIVTWMEVLIGARDEDEERIVRPFLSSFELAPLDETVAEKAVFLRRTYKLKLPDALIWATAQTRDLVLVTRNSRDFPERHPGVRVPYVI